MILIRHTLYNFLGLGLPSLVAIFCIPILLKELGDVRFGLLTLIWAFVNYFGLFDLGLGRALTQNIAVALATKDQGRIGPLIMTSIALMGVLGIIAGVLMAFLAPWSIGLIQSVADKDEAINAILIMALAMPAVIVISGLRGVLEARHAFAIINLIRLPMGLFNFLGPVFVVLYGKPSLEWIVAVLATGRIIACAAHAWYAWDSMPSDHGRLVVRKDFLKPLCISGGWLTLSNVISPFMGYVDRFFIGSIVSSAAVAYYIIPQELITKIWIVPGALTTVLFPTFATQIAQDSKQTRQLFDKTVYWLFLMLFPITAVFALFAHEILSIWVGPNLATHSALLMQIFAIGILINCLAHVPYTLIQGAGMPRVTAIIHCGELPFFLALLWWLTSEYGVIGAAIAWFARMLVDTLLMFILCNFLQGWTQRAFINIKTMLCFGLSITVFSGVYIESSIARAGLVVITFLVLIGKIYGEKKSKPHALMVSF